MALPVSDLPAPDSPTTPRTSPGAISNETSSTASSVPRRVERIDDGLRQESLREPVNFDLERALLAEHRLDAPEPRAPQQPREPAIEPLERVFGERRLFGFPLLHVGQHLLVYRGLRMIFDRF